MPDRFQDSPEVVAGRTLYSVLPDNPIDSIPKTVVTPNVANRQRLKCINTGPITITNFKGGAAGQTIKLLGEGQTTIANNANIKTNTGGAKLLALNIVYTYTLFGAIWYEDA